MVTYSYLMADRPTWDSDQQTVDGKRMIILGEKKSIRQNPKKTQYYFTQEGSRAIYYRVGRGGPHYIPMARHHTNMEMYYQVFTGEVTPADKEYLDRYGVVLYNA